MQCSYAITKKDVAIPYVLQLETTEGREEKYQVLEIIGVDQS